MKNRKSEMWGRQAKWIEDMWSYSKRWSSDLYLMNFPNTSLDFNSEKDAQAFKDNAIKFCEEQASKYEK